MSNEYLKQKRQELMDKYGSDHKSKADIEFGFTECMKLLCPEYDRLEAMCEKLAGALEDAQWMLEELKAAQAEECEKALAEYRTMRDQTKMPCPRNE